MEKYGVSTPSKPGGEKTAGIKDTCPQCGGKLTSQANVKHCETCGTKPFEAVPQDEK